MGCHPCTTWVNMPTHVLHDHAHAPKGKWSRLAVQSRLAVEGFFHALKFILLRRVMVCKVLVFEQPSPHLSRTHDQGSFGILAPIHLPHQLVQSDWITHLGLHFVKKIDSPHFLVVSNLRGSRPKFLDITPWHFVSKGQIVHRQLADLLGVTLNKL